MSYQLKIIQDYPIGFWTLDETSGTAAYDISGCSNNGTYTGGITTGLIPLVSGGANGSLITNTKYITLPVTKDYYGSTADGGFADNNSSDNQFSLEVWIYPKIVSTDETPIFADTAVDTGIFWNSGNIIFKLQGEELHYTLPHISQSHHIVATYSSGAMSIYVDGKFGSTKVLNNFKFTNETIELAIGPTVNAGDSFIVDAPAIYRYVLGPDRILEHYGYSGVTPPLQVVFPDRGTLFDIYDDSVSKQFNFIYPVNKSWEYFLTEDLVYNGDEKYLEIKKTDSTGSKSVVLLDAIAIPAGFNLDSSKIEWSGDNGVSVRTSTDDITYEDCINGRAIPQFKLDEGSFSTDRILYIEITFSSEDTSKYLPRLYNLIISFYNQQLMYASTNADYIYTIDNLAGATVKEITLGRISYPVLSRHNQNGLKTADGSGFRVNTFESVQTLEFFLTLSSLSSNCIILTEALGDFISSEYSWGNTGIITKTNISDIYVNGVSRIAETNVSGLFQADELYHVVIVLDGQASGQLMFNYSTSGGASSLYQYISYYPQALTSADALTHYDLYIGKSAAIADDSSMTMTENSIEYYNNDWIVLQSK